MGVWTSALLHQFPDGNLGNYHALPGGPDSPFVQPGPRVVPTPPPDERGFAFVPGQRFRHDFARTLTDVIGIDVRLDILPVPDEAVFARLNLDAVAGLSVNLTGTGIARIRLSVGQEVLDAEPQVPTSGLVRIRARWHTHGQAQLWINDELRRYRPGMAVNGSIGIGSVGLSGPPGDPHDGPAPRARLVSVKVLRREDPIRYLDGLVPIDPPVAVSPACARIIRGTNFAIQTLLREFMIATIPLITHDWASGDAGAPFSDEANAAHQAAVTGASAFVRFLAGEDGAAVDQAMDGIVRFLTLLQGANPAGYAALLARIAELELSLDERCRAALEQAGQENADRLLPIAALLNQIWAKAQAIGGQP